MSANLRAGAVSGTECRRRSKGRGRRSEQRERGLFRALKMRRVRQGLLLARYASENASRTLVSCPQSVESAALRAFEDASRTRGGCFWHRISLPYRRSLFFAPNASEDASRTPGSLFEHGTHIRYRRWPSPVPNANHPTTQPPSHHSTPSTPVPNARHTAAGCRRSGA